MEFSFPHFIASLVLFTGLGLGVVLLSKGIETLAEKLSDDIDQRFNISLGLLFLVGALAFSISFGFYNPSSESEDKDRESSCQCQSEDQQ
jgi:hypothetical protein